MNKNLKRNLKKKNQSKELKKVIDVNNLFISQIENIINKYDLEETEKTNLSKMIVHFKNLNQLFNNFKK